MADPVDIHQLSPRRGALWELITVDMSRKPATPAASFPAPLEQTSGTFTSGRGPDLAIDFGTSAIVVALVGGAQAVEVLRLGDEMILPSPLPGRQFPCNRAGLLPDAGAGSVGLADGSQECLPGKGKAAPPGSGGLGAGVSPPSRGL